MSAKNWLTEAKQYADEMTAESRARLAELLSIPVDALDAMPMIGASMHTERKCYTFPECDAEGAIIGLNRRFKDGAKKMLPGGKRGLTIPEGWHDRPGPLLLVEGASDTLALVAAGLCVVGRPSNIGGAALLIDLLRDWPIDRSIIVIGENDKKEDGDWPGRMGAEKTAQRLADALNRGVSWALPPEEAKDVRHWLTASARGSSSWAERGQELSDFLEAHRTIIEPGSVLVGSMARPEIVIDTEEHLVNDLAVDAIAKDDSLFQRGGSLVQLIEQDHDSEDDQRIRRPTGSTILRTIPRPLLRELFTRCASWKVWRGSGEDTRLEDAHPPEWCVSAVHARGDWPRVRPLDAILTHPVILPDGRILFENGYHASARLVLAIPANLVVSVPDHPTRADVTAAVETLLDPIQDFPFEAESHRSAFFASLLTPLAWFAFQGPAPMFLIDKNVRGAGAGLLADVVALIVTGRRFPVMSYTNDREELRKRITTLAVEGERLVLLDNLAGAVGNDILDAALTTDLWKDRILGGNTVYNGPLHVVWFATGNNVQLAADTSRRVCHIRMESHDERPELKSGFRYPHLRDHILTNRVQLLSAALTILRAYILAGKPSHKLTPWGSYEHWSEIVREAVVFAGLPDPGETRIQLQTTADRDACAMGDILDALAIMDTANKGMTTAEFIKALKEDSATKEYHVNARAAIEELCGKLHSRALAIKFRTFKRRNFNGRMLDIANKGQGTNHWCVVSVSSTTGPKHRHHPHHHHQNDPETSSSGGDGGDGGDVLAHSPDDFSKESIALPLNWRDMLPPD